MEWTKKYEPKEWDEMIGNKDIDMSILANINSKTHKPILLYGEPGTGKTSRGRLIAKTLLGEAYRVHMLDLNASDDNGVDVVRNVIAPRTKYRSVTGDCQVILIDEIDYMTPNAQAALRRVIEDSSENAQFILVTNDITKVIKPLKDRCRSTTYHVLGVSDDEMYNRLAEIAALEGIENCDINTIVDDADGSMRSALKILESYSNNSTYTTKTPTGELKAFMRNIKNGDTLELLQQINDDNLDALAKLVINNNKLGYNKICSYVRLICEADIAIQHSHNPDVHLLNLIIELKKV